MRFTGRIPHDEVESHYSLIDIVAYPRKPLPVCEMVSPVKPFEAMAMEKALLASDVAALELAADDTRRISGRRHTLRSPAAYRREDG